VIYAQAPEVLFVTAFVPVSTNFNMVKRANIVGRKICLFQFKSQGLGGVAS
jgi:hypothetical protein